MLSRSENASADTSVATHTQTKGQVKNIMPTRWTDAAFIGMLESTFAFSVILYLFPEKDRMIYNHFRQNVAAAL